MATDPYAITMHRGDSYPIIITLRDASTGDVVDLTGASAKLTVTSNRNPTDNTTKIFDVTGAIVDPLLGKISFFPTALNTATVGKFFYDVQVTALGGYPSSVRTVIKSTFTVSQDNTK